MVDPADVAAVLVTALTETGHTGKIYRVSGPEALTPGDQVDVLAEVLGRELRFDIFRDHPRFESDNQPTVQQLLGRAPGRLRGWLEAIARASYEQARFIPRPDCSLLPGAVRQ